MADLKHPLPGGSNLTIDRHELHDASTWALDMGRQLAQAEYASPSIVQSMLEECQRSTIRIGHSLGLILTFAKLHSGERAAQRLDMALQDQARKHQAGMAARAGSADVLRHKLKLAEERAEVAEETVRNLTDQIERVRAQNEPLHLVAAE